MSLSILNFNLILFFFLISIMETIRALQEAVAASRVDKDHFQVDLARSQANNEELCRTNEELRKKIT